MEIVNLQSTTSEIRGCLTAADRCTCTVRLGQIRSILSFDVLPAA
jgi:hypothetical protein